MVVAALSILLAGSTVRAWSQLPALRERLAHDVMAATAALFLGSWPLLG